MLLRTGRYRIGVKTASDRGASRIDWTPAPASVAALAALPRPAIGRLGRRVDEECRVYRLTARLCAAKIELDGDVHLVISDPDASTLTMIAEIPLPDLLPGRCGQRAEIIGARWTFERAYPAIHDARLVPIHGTAIIEGVLFYDELHGQAGACASGAEIHPVTRFELLPEVQP